MFEVGDLIKPKSERAGSLLIMGEVYLVVRDPGEVNYSTPGERVDIWVAGEFIIPKGPYPFDSERFELVQKTAEEYEEAIEMIDVYEKVSGDGRV